MIQEASLSQSENLVKSEKKKLYFSVDLEDFTFDVHRSLGLEPKVNFKALDKCYERINSFAEDHFNSKKITFFTTGTVALTYPKLLKRIADDGHEIACHYHFHDLMYQHSLQEVESNIVLAREAIKAACGEYPTGFRAPAFSIEQNRGDVYLLLSKYFKYDSSYVLHDHEIKNGAFKENIPFKIDGFQEFPIITKPWLRKFNLKSGGTFFRLFNTRNIIGVLNKSLEHGFIPLIYLHPYDFLSEYEFKVSLKTYISPQNPIKGIYKYLRQFQWLGLGNKGSFKKLKTILLEFEHAGTMNQELSKT